MTGIELYSIVEKEQIDCNLEEVSSYVVTNYKYKTLEKEIELLKKFKVKIKETNKLLTDEKIGYAYYVEDTFVFHPIKYIHALKKICEEKNISIPIRFTKEQIK